MTGAILVVGSDLGYQPATAIPNIGALLEVRPVVLPDGKQAADNVKSIVTQWNEPEPPGTVGGQIAVDRPNLHADELETTVRVPLGQPVLLGGLSSPGAAGEDGQPRHLYLVVQVDALYYLNLSCVLWRAGSVSWPVSSRPVRAECGGEDPWAHARGSPEVLAGSDELRRPLSPSRSAAGEIGDVYRVRSCCSISARTDNRQPRTASPMLHRRACFAWLLAVVFSVAPPIVHAQEKAAFPPEEAQQRAMQLAKEVYGEEYAAAKTPQLKGSLAERLLAKAPELRDDPPGHVVLLRLARDIAVQSGELELALRAIDQLDATYRVDVHPMRVEAILKAAKATSDRKQQRAIAARAPQAADEAVRRDDFTAARELAVLASAGARRAGDAELARSIAQRAKAIEAAEQAFLAARPALEKLEQSPADAEANLAAGRYYCFVKGDWDIGIPMLAKGSDGALKTLAANELTGTASETEQLELADGWWDRAETETDPAQTALRARAARWYRQAVPGLTGLQKVLVEKRLADFAASEPKAPSSPITSSLAPAAAEPQENWTSLFDGRSLRGWTPDHLGARWGVVDGAITAVGDKGHLYHARPFTDFHARAELKINRTGNSGFYFRTRPDPVHPNGYEVQIIGIGAPGRGGTFTGGLFKLRDVLQEHIRYDQWFTLEVIAQGNRLMVKIDGTTVTDYVDPNRTHQSGVFAVQQWSADTRVFWRKIEVRPLAAADR